MCYNTRNIVTNKKYINANSIGTFSCYQPIQCGKCYECLKAKEREYTHRSDAQYRATIDKGGFCFWETFTYSPDNVPIYWADGRFEHGESNINNLIFKKFVDYVPVFDRRDFVLFMKKLRINLHRKGYEVYTYNQEGNRVNNLKYFFVSEYGEKKGRPHYHSIFYVSIPNITPDAFYRTLKESWNLGILYEYHKDGSSVNVSEKVINGQGAINYVAKYVTKPLEYMNRLEPFLLSNNISKEDFKNFVPFHRQSQGFGIDIINQQDYQLMFNTGKMVYNDVAGKHIVDIPTYIKRKLFYICKKYTDGSYHWEPTDEGVKFLTNIAFQQIYKIEERFRNLMCQIPVLEPDDNTINESILHLLNGRTLMDLATYVRIYQGKYIPFKLDNLPSVNSMLQNYYTIPIDYSNYKELENDIFLNKSMIYKNDRKFLNSVNNSKCLNLHKFCKNHAITQDSFPCFTHFDEILEIFHQFEYQLNQLKKQKEQEKRDVSKRLQILKW